MKKYRIVALVFLAASAAVALASDNADNGFGVRDGEHALTAETPVFRTTGGKRYHRENCPSIAKSKSVSEVTLLEAVRAGLSPCKTCKPPELAVLPEEVAREMGAIYRLNKEDFASYRDADIGKMLRAKVTRAIDGDTVELLFENPPSLIQKTEKTRLIGCDTPESVHPRKGLEYFGKEASDYTKKALVGKNVYIAFDWDTRDKYGRLLTYIYTAPGACHNAALIATGHAHAYTRFPFTFMEEFRALEREARAEKRGLWAAPGS